MKKLRYLMGIVFLLIITTACGTAQENPNSTMSTIDTVDDILSSQMAQEDTQEPTADNSTANTPSEETSTSDAANEAGSEDAVIDSDVDVDLTELSSTMVYGEIYNMVTTPLVYHGKTIKLTGFYDEYYDVMTDTLYCSVFVLDALACCAQGLEVQFSEEYVYPDDYPTDGDEITIEATFEIYYPDESKEYFYYHLVDAVVLA